LVARKAIVASGLDVLVSGPEVIIVFGARPSAAAQSPNVSSVVARTAGRNRTAAAGVGVSLEMM